MARAFGVSAGLPASDSASSNGDAQPQGAHGPQPQRVLQHKRDRVVGWCWFGPAPYRTPECLWRIQLLPWTRIGQIIYLSTRIEFESGTYSESFMPRFDLRQDDGTLHPLASFKVLAVMCHPSNLVLREKMLGTTEKETGGLRPRRQPATAEMFIKSI